MKLLKSVVSMATAALCTLLSASAGVTAARKKECGTCPRSFSMVEFMWDYVLYTVLYHVHPCSTLKWLQPAGTTLEDAKQGAVLKLPPHLSSWEERIFVFLSTS